jgi:hypothetical protein
MASTCPGISTRVALGLRDSVRTNAPRKNAITPMGRLTKKIACQPDTSISSPPTSGPAARATPEISDQMPKRLGALSGHSKSDRRVEEHHKEADTDNGQDSKLSGPSCGEHSAYPVSWWVVVFTTSRPHGTSAGGEYASTMSCKT